MINDFYEMILIVSNKYKQLCEVHQYPSLDIDVMDVIDKDLEIIEFDQAKILIDKLIQNANKRNVVPSLLLLGGDDVGVWPTTLRIIEYCRSMKKFIKITLQVENIEQIHSIYDICYQVKKYDIRLRCIYSDKTKDFIPLFLERNPYMQIYLPLNCENYLQLYNIYMELNTLKAKKLKILFNYYEFNNTSTFNIQLLLPQLTQIKEFIQQEFLNNNIPLIPFNYDINFIMILVNNIEKNNDVQYFSTGELVQHHCKMVLGDMIIANQNGELYLCSNKHLNQYNTNAYCGYIHENEIYEKDDLNIFYHIYKCYLVQEHTLFPQSEIIMDCDKCTRVTTCSTGCFCNNLINSDDALNPLVEYCIINQHIKELMEEIVSYFNTNKNILFKEYFYMACQKGTDGI